MPTSNSDSNTAALVNMRNDVTQIQKQLATQEVLISRFDTALDKISEVSLNVSKLLAVHEQRLEAAEEKSKELPLLVETQRTENNKRFELANDRITGLEQVMRNEMTTMHKEIITELKGVREDMSTLGEDIKTDVDDKLIEVDKRIDKLERAHWLVIGGAAVISFLITIALAVGQYFFT